MTLTEYGTHADMMFNVKYTSTKLVNKLHKTIMFKGEKKKKEKYYKNMLSTYYFS